MRGVALGSRSLTARLGGREFTECWLHPGVAAGRASHWKVTLSFVARGSRGRWSMGQSPSMQTFGAQSGSHREATESSGRPMGWESEVLICTGLVMGERALKGRGRDPHPPQQSQNTDVRAL